MCVSLFVISEISGMGGRGATLFSPMWRALLGELFQLLLELTGCLVCEENPLEHFHRKCLKPPSSRYNGTIVKILVMLLKCVELFHLQLGCSKEEERPCWVRSVAKAHWKLWHLGNVL